MDWKNYFENKVHLSGSSRRLQVGKTILGNAVSDEQILTIHEQIKRCLEIKKIDDVLDLGCGNGLLTGKLAMNCGSVVGLDFCDSLIFIAKKNNHRSNVSYVIRDLRKLPRKEIRGKSKFFMYEVIQHLTKQEFIKFIRNLSEVVDKKSMLFLGGVPDEHKKRNFYDTDEKYRFFLDMEKIKVPHLGSWWTRYNLSGIARRYGWQLLFIKQPENLYTSHYRFDALLIKL